MGHLMNHVFDFAKVNVHWFPSHMARGIQAMERKLRKTDIIVEIRDARIPFSSANPILESLSQDMKRIVVFNKTDLADPASNRVNLSRLDKTHDNEIEIGVIFEKKQFGRIYAHGLDKSETDHQTTRKHQGPLSSKSPSKARA